MDVKKPVYQFGHVDRTEPAQSKQAQRGKGGGAQADFATELARCQETGGRNTSKADLEQEREERVRALKKKVADGMYRADLHEVARNLLFSDNSEPLL